MKKTMTQSAISRRFEKACRASGAPTRRQRAAEQRMMDQTFRMEGRIAEIASELSEEIRAARRIAEARIAATLAESAADAATVAAATVAAAIGSGCTLEDVAAAETNAQIRFRVWRGPVETRVYVDVYNGSRGRPWLPKGYYRVDEAARTVDRSQADRRGPVEAFEAALAAFLN